MTTIEDQIEIEKRMVAFGISRYRHSVSAAEEKDRAADTQYATTLIHGFVQPIGEAIDKYCQSTKAGSRAKYKVLLRQIDPIKAAYFGLRCLLNHFTQDSTLHKLANHIGTMVEDELKFSRFHEQHGQYFETIINDFKKKGTKNYRHMHRVLTNKANEKAVYWKEWGLADKIAVGIKIIDIIMEETDLAEKSTHTHKNKTVVNIVPSPQALEWIKDYHHFAELLNPDRVPCVIPPADWRSIKDGGYYTPQLRSRTPMVKTRSKQHDTLFEGDISNITEAINAIQNVPWQVNKRVLDVFQQAWAKSLTIGLPSSEPFPIPVSPVEGKPKAQFTEEDRIAFEEWKAEARIVHTMERDRVSKCFQVIRVVRLAHEYEQYNKFWYVYQCDFRGRVYATTSGLSPQGPDYAKGLIHFANPKPLTERGAYWLAVHGANTFGEDKLPYDDRVEWVKNNVEFIKRTAEDPLSHVDFWGNADKPWQFLAFCFEYERYLREGPSMMSQLPIALDGSCNGLQNFSAMLRDEVGGKATNLVPQGKPSDIYSEVARVCTSKLVNETGELADRWKAFAAEQPDGILPRALTKRPVMTLPYGSTRQSCREYIYKFMLEDAPESFPRELRFKMSVFLTPILWDAISSVVIAGRKAMDYLQESAGRVARSNNAIVWWTPLGFPVLQDRKEVQTKQIETELMGRFQIRIGENSDKMDVNKNRLGVAPNFVHSMDSCHLMMTCTRAVEYGVTDFAFIHDDYGTHAADTETLHQAIREAFVEMYEENDPLVDFKIYNEDKAGIKLNDPPARGSLNIGQVLESEYFFG